MTDLSSLSNIQLFRHVLQGRPPVIPAKNQSYTLQEDLQIIVSLHDTDYIKSKNFKDLQDNNIIQRTYHSIKDRYREYLNILNEENLNQIADHIRESGLVGYLQFTNTTPRRLLKILTIDPKTLASERKKVEEELNVDAEPKKAKTEPKKNIDPTFPRNEFDKFILEDLDQILGLLAESKNVPKAYLVERLHQLSGNLEDLDNLFVTNDDTYCFIEEEDQLLKDERNKNSPAIRLLIRKKGLTRVQRRLRYLGATGE